MNKTRILLVCAALMVSVLAANAQVQFAVGIKGGPNFAKINADDGVAGNYKNRTGFHAGAFALIKLTKIGIQPELIFSQQGSTVKFNSQDLEQNFTYINVPIILKLYTVAGINLQLGPQFGFNNKAEVETLVGGVKTTMDVKDRLKGTDLTLALGAGWDLPFGLTIDARYNMGLSKVYDNAPNQQTEKAKNQVFQVSVGFKLIKLGK